MIIEGIHAGTMKARLNEILRNMFSVIEDKG